MLDIDKTVIKKYLSISLYGMFYVKIFLFGKYLYFSRPKFKRKYP